MKYTTIRKKLGIEVVKEQAEDFAVLTHQLQSDKDLVFNSFEEEATAYIKKLNGSMDKQSLDAVSIENPYWMGCTF